MEDWEIKENEKNARREKLTLDVATALMEVDREHVYNLHTRYKHIKGGYVQRVGAEWLLRVIDMDLESNPHAVDKGKWKFFFTTQNEHDAAASVCKASFPYGKISKNRGIPALVSAIKKTLADADAEMRKVLAQFEETAEHWRKVEALKNRMLAAGDGKFTMKNGYPGSNDNHTFDVRGLDSVPYLVIHPNSVLFTGMYSVTPEQAEKIIQVLIGKL